MSARSEVLTASDSSMGNSGGTTDVRMSVHSRNNLYLLRVGFALPSQTHRLTTCYSFLHFSIINFFQFHTTMFLWCFDKNIGWAPAKSIRPINVSVRRPKVNSNQLTETECSCSCSKVCQHAGQLSQNSTFDMHTTYFIHKGTEGNMEVL